MRKVWTNRCGSPKWGPFIRHQCWEGQLQRRWHLNTEVFGQAGKMGEWGRTFSAEEGAGANIWRCESMLVGQDQLVMHCSYSAAWPWEGAEDETGRSVRKSSACQALGFPHRFQFALTPPWPQKIQLPRTLSKPEFSIWEESRVFQILQPVQSFQSSDDKEMRNYVFPTISSSNWFLLLRSLLRAWE